ncbi:g11251 [Coccomyxa viridis]|uniref:G11251 protein n=1 Tax=Coccomyxa viridis TaxID=1274662 RepID=A0ABP1G7G2_9CHLO
MDWDSLLPSLPESPCNSQNAWEYPVQADEVNKEALLLFIAGEWIGALQTKALIPIVSGHARAWNNAEIQEAADRGGVTDLYVNNVNGGDSKEAQLADMLAAVAALHVFLQANLTGPVAASFPESLQDLPSWTPQDAAEKAPATGKLGEDTDHSGVGDRWAMAQLSASGEDVVGRVRCPQYLLLARTLLLGRPGTGLPWKWWALRTLAVQQRILSGPAATLQTEIEQLTEEVLEGLQGDQLPPQLQGRRKELQSCLRMEAVVQALDVGRVADAQKHLIAAEQRMGVSSEVTGALGVRTVHQTDARAQLVVRTARQGDLSSTDDSGDEAEWLDACAGGQPDEAQAASSQPSQSSMRSKELEGLSGDSDVLPVPKFVNAEGHEEQEAALSSGHQALLLGQAGLVQKGTSGDELRQWRMAPYLDAVLQQKRSRFLIRLSAQLLRARHERERNRTRERALLALQQVVEATEQPLPPPAQRMRHAFSVRFPMGPVLRKELGEQLVAAGLVGAAMTLFEELELWDALILCYRLLQKNVQAEELVHRRLEVTPNDPRLWCALGDLTLKDEHYETAWQRSGQRSTRAQRSLARSAQREKNYEKAAQHWELALGVNPLHPEGWFSLGYCALKQQDFARALQAFSRCAQQQPDNGDAWNNLAAIHLQERHFKEAFSALSEAVKFKRESWQTWSNYAHAAVQTQNHLQAARGILQVLAFSGGQRREEDLASALVAAVADARRNAGTYGVETPAPAAGTAAARSRAAQLEQAVGNVLKQSSAASSGAGSATWGQYADYYAALGFHASAREALLKQVRGLQSGGWQKDAQQFQAYGEAVAKYATAQTDGVSRSELSKRDLSAVRMLVRGLLKQAAEQYEDTPLFAELQGALDRVAALEKE